MSAQIATFTVSSFNELKSIKALHPKRVVKNGDLCLLSGGENNDDYCFFSAQITNTPVTSLPSSIGSYDGRIQWNMVANGFFSGNAPKGLVQDGILTAPSDLWEIVGSNPPFIRCCGAVHEWWPNIYEGFSLGVIGDDMWLVNRNITKLNLTTKQTTLYPIGTLPDGYTDLDNHSRCVAKDTGLIHILGYDKSHSVFDTVTGVMSYASKAAFPSVMAYNSFFIDSSKECGKLFCISTHNWSSGIYYIYRYDILSNTWSSALWLLPSIPNAVTKDISRPGKLLILLSNNTVYSFDPVAETLVLLFTLSGNSVCNTGYPTSAIWDTVTGECLVFDTYDCYVLDPITGTTRVITNMMAADDQIGQCGAYDLGGGVFFIHDYDHATYRIIKISTSYKIKKVK
jgi:hypothetical protein